MPNADDPSSQSSRRALVIARLGTMLALIAFTAPLSTLNATADALRAGVAGRTWILSSVRNNSAYVLAMAGRADEAIHILKNATDPDFVMRATLGLAHLAIEDFEEGPRWYREAASEADAKDLTEHSLMTRTRHLWSLG